MKICKVLPMLLSFAASQAIAQAPANDACNNAIALSCTDGLVTTGTTFDATQDPGIPSCGLTIGTAPDVWYKFTGNGGLTTVSTCLGANYNPNLRVFTGNCGALNCVAANEDAAACGQLAEVSFPTVNGTTYLINVSGSGAQSGTFKLTVACSAPVVPPNDLCANAIPAFCHSVFSGDNIGATPDGTPLCNGVGGNVDKGVWYSFVGNGGFSSISTCLSTDFDSKLAVFTGGCGALTCVAANDNACDLKAHVGFQTVNGTNYLVFVGGSLEGHFRLNINCSDPGTPNDDCLQAIPITCGSSVTGNNQNAFSQAPVFTNCGGNGINRDVWYSFTGNGQPVILSTCAGSDFNTQIQVFTGSCGDLTCVGGNNNACGTRSEFDFITTNGTKYFVKIDGDFNNAGNFTLSLTCGPPPNDKCANATTINCGQTLFGTNTNSTLENLSLPSCGNAQAASTDVWFKFTGNGLVNTLSTCTGFDLVTRMAVYSGTCGNLTCISANYSFCGTQAQVSFLAISGTNYLIRINGVNNTVGTFTLIRTCTSLPSNDNCSNAINLACGSTLNGTTIGATSENTSSCGITQAASPSVWYKVTGTGGTVTVSTCPGGTFNTQLRVYVGLCGQLTLACVASNDDAPGCGQLSQVSFPTTLGLAYRIKVNGAAVNQFGSFSISATCSGGLHDDGGELAISETPQVGSPASFLLYPNPASGDVQFQITALPEPQPIELEIYDLLGHRVLFRAFGNMDFVDERIDLGGIGNGMYIARVKMGNEQATQRLVVAK